MKHFLTFLLSFILSTALAQAIRLDDPYSKRDYIPIAKPNRSVNTYHFQHPALTHATITTRRPKRGDSYDGGDMLDDFLSDLFLTKLNNSSSSSTDMTWLVRANIKCNDDSLNWVLELFVNGTLEKEKVRTENPDGSVSKSTKKTIRLNWQHETIGVITENEVPISKFVLITYPGQDSFFIDNFPEAYKVPNHYIDENGRFKYSSFGYVGIEFALFGEFKGSPFTIIYNGSSTLVSIFMNGVFLATFQPDFDDLSKELRGKVMPYLLVNTDVTDESIADLLRLSMISKYLSKTITKSTYKKI